MNKIIFLISIFVLIIFIISCPGTGDTGDDGGDKPKPEGTINPPDSVNASKSSEGREINIVWDNVNEASSYTVYKKLESGEYQTLKNGVGSNSYTYKEYAVDTDIFYGVKSVKGSLTSEMKSTIDPLNLALNQAMIPAKPTVKSFSTPNGIIVEWEADLSSDSYVIYRDSNYNGDYSIKIYEGTDLSFTDATVTLGQFYYYKLALVMDGSEYQKSQYNYGVASSSNKDNFEDNNIIEDAVILEYNSINSANIYNYGDNADNKLIDFDWYYVNVPAQTTYAALIDNFTDILDDDLYFKEDGKSPSLILEGDGFYLINNTDNTKIIRFQIYTNAGNFINKFGSYKIKIE